MQVKNIGVLVLGVQQEDFFANVLSELEKAVTISLPFLLVIVT